MIEISVAGASQSDLTHIRQFEFDDSTRINSQPVSEWQTAGDTQSADQIHMVEVSGRVEGSDDHAGNQLRGRSGRLAIFRRALSAEEVKYLFEHPDQL